jgi:PKD repeat protein
MLYNPTTSDDGTEAGGVLYADAIEFDITGEYLIYDALNVLSSNNEDDLHYWDIGFINVWDNASGDFGSGKISKLFTSLPKNVSIGNPVFSKNSPSIIAFDYKYDDEAVEDDEVYAVYGGNLESGLINRITYITTWGYPSFSKNDDRIAFTALTTMGDAVVAYVDLEEDKITAAGEASILVDGSIWPVYYATGDRTLGLAPVADFTVDKKSGSAPLKIQFMDLSTNEPSAWLWTFQGGTPSSSTLQNPEVTYNTAGTYQVTLKATNSIGNNTKTKPAYLVISASTGLPDAEASVAVFYPNPMHDLLTIACDGNFMVKIFNLQGSLMMSAENEAQLDVSVLSPGVYMMELRTENGLSRHKLLKQ